MKPDGAQAPMPPWPVRMLQRLGDAGGTLTTAVIWLLAATVTYDVVVRALGVPTLWAGEVSIYLMIAMAFLGAGSTQGVDGHFRVSFFRDRCAPRVRALMDLIAVVFSLVFAVALTFGAARLSWLSWSLDFRSSTILQVPMWILQGLVVAGGALLSLAYLRDILLILRGGSRLRDASGPAEVI